MAIDTDLYNMLGQLTFGLPVQQDVIDISTSDTGTRVWYQRSGFDPQLFNSGEAALTTETYDVEVIGTNIFQVQEQAFNVRTLNGYRGRLGDPTTGTAVCVVWVHDQADNYVAKNAYANDQGYHICSVKLEIIY